MHLRPCSGNGDPQHEEQGEESRGGVAAGARGPCCGTGAPQGEGRGGEGGGGGGAVRSQKVQGEGT